MQYTNTLIFAVCELENAVKVLENGEPLHSENHLSNVAQRFMGAADFARDDSVSSAFLLSLGIVLNNIASDSTAWHIVPELHMRLKKDFDAVFTGDGDSFPF